MAVEHRCLPLQREPHGGLEGAWEEAEWGKGGDGAGRMVDWVHKGGELSLLDPNTFSRSVLPLQANVHLHQLDL